MGNKKVIKATGKHRISLGDGDCVTVFPGNAYEIDSPIAKNLIAAGVGVESEVEVADLSNEDTELEITATAQELADEHGIDVNMIETKKPGKVGVNDVKAAIKAAKE